MQKAKIKLKNVYKTFGNNSEQTINLLKTGLSKQEIFEKNKNTVGVIDAEFEIYEGEILVIMGLSGSGKSTLLRCLNRLIEPSSGIIEINGIDITKLNKNELRIFRQKTFGMVFQHFALFPHKKIIDNVAYGLEIQNLSKKERHKKALEVLELVGLKEWKDSFPDQLSGGMQQRVGLARALAVDPEILLMDEAFSALDPLIRTEMQDELIELQSKVKKTIIFITHDLDESLKMGDRIVLMKDAKIVQIGTPEDILSNPSNSYVKKFLENVDYTKILTAEDVMIRPKAHCFSTEGPKTCLRRMQTHEFSGLFVVDKNHRLKGYITAELAAKLIKQNISKIEEYIELFEKQCVLPDTPIRELFSVMVDNRYPVAVVNDENKLRGIIVNGSIIASLAEGVDIND